MLIASDPTYERSNCNFIFQMYRPCKCNRKCPYNFQLVDARQHNEVESPKQSSSGNVADDETCIVCPFSPT